jgi:hypothetical protein
LDRDRERGFAMDISVPGWKRDDGKMLIDARYLPPEFVFGQSRYEILSADPLPRADHWANHICLIKIIIDPDASPAPPAVLLSDCR